MCTGRRLSVKTLAVIMSQCTPTHLFPFTSVLPFSLNRPGEENMQNTGEPMPKFFTVLDFVLGTLLTPVAKSALQPFHYCLPPLKTRVICVDQENLVCVCGGGGAFFAIAKSIPREIEGSGPPAPL